jgi:hypothetical protein
MTRHPLIGKLLRWDSEDGSEFSVSRFDAELGDSFFLLRRLCPNHGEDLGMSHVLSLGELAVREGAEIYDDWETLTEKRPLTEDEEEGGGDVIQLH